MITDILRLTTSSLIPNFHHYQLVSINHIPSTGIEVQYCFKFILFFYLELNGFISQLMTSFQKRTKERTAGWAAVKVLEIFAILPMPCKLF